METDLPTVLPESFTTLPEDRFYIGHELDVVYCGLCRKDVVTVDPHDDLNTLIRLSHSHLAECRGEANG